MHYIYVAKGLDLQRRGWRLRKTAGTGGHGTGGGVGDHVVGTSRLAFGLEIGGTHDLF